MIPDAFYLKMIEDIEDYAILFLNTEGRVESWNKGAEKIKGYKQDEITGQNFAIFYTDEDQKNGLPQQLVAEAILNGKALQEGWRIRKDKSKFWGSVVLTAVYDNDGELLGFTKVTRDLTDKKLAEESLLEFNRRLEQRVREQNDELHRNERRFRALVENNYDAIFLRNLQGDMVYHSPGAEKITGYTLEEIQLIDREELFHPDDLEGVNERMGICMRNPGRPVYGEYRMLHKEGHYIWLEGTVTNMLHDEHVNALVGNFRDITERKYNEEKIMQANRLYAYVSAINQTIVHVQDKDILYNEACRIAVEIGKFEMAWIAIPNEATKRIDLGAHHNTIPADLAFLQSRVYNDEGANERVMKKGEYYAVNDLSAARESPTQAYALDRGFNSFITLPIQKHGVTIGSLNLASLQLNMFDEQEIRLLQEVVGDISFALDVFEKEKHRKAAEEKTAHSEYRLKQAQAIAHLGSWELDFVTGIGTWSEECCRIYGLAPEDKYHNYDEWSSFIHPDDVDEVIRQQQEATAKNLHNAFFHRIIRRDGTVRHLFSQSEVEYKDGVVAGLYGVVHDITDMRLAEDALQRSMANLGMIIDLLPQSVSVKDYQGRFLFVNKNFAALYGLEPSELVGKEVGDIIPGQNDSMFFLNQDKEVIDNWQTTTMPASFFVDHAGNKRLFHTTKVPYSTPKTDEKAVLSISEDITDQKRIEEERTKMISDIIQRNKDLEQFSYIVSHNLRAPVANIIGFTNLFDIIDDDEVEKRKMMKGLSVSVTKLDDVIKDLNHILQVRNQVSENKEPVAFSKLVQDIAASIQSLLTNEDVHVISDFSAVDEMFSIRSYLYSIFFNLISNSVKYRRNGVQPVIEITSSKDAHGTTLVFKDNGLGIDLKQRGEYVFGLYKRFHDHVDGKGVGLYMVKTQVETLGGKISIESEVNVGTTFSIIFENK